MFLTHLHLMSGHIPILGTIVAAVILVYSLLKNNSGLFKTSLWLFILSALALLVVYFTGDPSAELARTLPGTNSEIIDNHEMFAQITLASEILLTILSAYWLFFEYKHKNINGLLKHFILAAAIMTSVAIGITGKLGGEIRHSEIITENVSK